MRGAVSSLKILILACILVCFVVFTAAAGAAEAAGLYPPNARPGECFARVLLPAVYGDVVETVTLRPAFERLQVEPAKFEEVEERVLVEEASSRIEVVPAEYEWVDEQVLVKPAATKIVEVPAVFETVIETAIDQPAHSVWKRSEGALEEVRHGTGEVMCLVEVPATYKTVTRRVLEQPATTRQIEIPAEYQTVRRKVMTKRPESRIVEVPARYETVRTMREVLAARVHTVTEPATTKTVKRRRRLADGKVAWKQVVCQSNLTRAAVAEVQTALKSAGYDPGPIDGIVGPLTREAIGSFQASRGLPEGHLTTALLRALEVDLAGLVAAQREIAKSVAALDRPAVVKLQRELRESGFNPGPIDGLVGPRTLAAAFRFERSRARLATADSSPPAD